MEDYEVGQKDVIFVCGKICSGKDTFADQLACHEKIVVSDTVKKIIKSTDRKKLSDTQSLDKEIANQLLIQIHAALKEKKKVTIVGVRQLSIMLKLQFYLQSNGITFEYVWLEVDDVELKRRYLTRGDEKDKSLTFEEALEKDDELGLGELEDWLTYQDELQLIYNQ